MRYFCILRRDVSIRYPTMSVETGRWSLSFFVWHISSVTLTLNAIPVPSVFLCSVSARATWTSEAVQDAGTHKAQWIAEKRGTRCPGWNSSSAVSPHGHM